MEYGEELNTEAEALRKEADAQAKAGDLSGGLKTMQRALELASADVARWLGASREVRECVKPLVESCIALYSDVAATLRPVPAKPHYTFNLRDISKVFQGVLMVDKRKIKGTDDFGKLGIHEIQRVFYDHRPLWHSLWGPMWAQKRPSIRAL